MTKKKIKFSIIIAVGADNPNLRKCLAHCLQLEYDSFEIIVLPDEKLVPTPRGVRVEPTGVVNPAYKRDRGAELARGEILAFLDDDAYPRGDWLREAALEFADGEIAALGGPGVTPPGAGLWERAGGLVYESPLGGGNYMYRYKPMPRKDVDDYPTCNLFVRRAVFLQIGGFDTDFWPGEDTKLCLDIISLKQRIVYSPRVLVYHHRRPLFAAHLRQVVSYARHRGYFVKRFPRTSLRLSYFLPSLFDLALLTASAAAFYYPGLRGAYLALIVVIGALFLVSSAGRGGGLLAVPVAALGSFLTHFAYGIFFVIGLLSGKLKEEN